jgi:hypothetical protein
MRDAKKDCEMDVMPALSKIGPLYTAGDFGAGLEELRRLWASIPEPKADTLNAYMVIEYGVAFSLKKGDLDEAQDWADLAPPFAEKRHDMGEVEFLVGKVAFERGDYALAKDKFLIANAKSESRLFKSAEKKYRDLIQ